nr:uncharacterized protein LOC133623202 isoform X2 [Nerophis lumbriciformis]
MAETEADPTKQPREPTPPSAAHQLSASVQSAWMSEDTSKETEVTDTCSFSQDTVKLVHPQPCLFIRISSSPSKRTLVWQRPSSWSLWPKRLPGGRSRSSQKSNAEVTKDKKTHMKTRGKHQEHKRMTQEHRAPAHSSHHSSAILDKQRSNEKKHCSRWWLVRSESHLHQCPTTFDLMMLVLANVRRGAVSSSGGRARESFGDLTPNSDP